MQSLIVLRHAQVSPFSPFLNSAQNAATKNLETVNPHPLSPLSPHVSIIHLSEVLPVPFVGSSANVGDVTKDVGIA